MQTVTTQAELDAALSTGVDWIDIRSPSGVWLQVKSNGSATVRACDSATVTAYGSATVTACDSATVRATPLVAIHLHSATVTTKGGTILDHTKADGMTAGEWCVYHGVTVNRGIATVFKAVNDAWTTARGTSYAPGSKPVCDDWRDNAECGGGLHFGPTPVHAQAYFQGATRYVAVGVRVSEMRVIPDGTAKCKAPRVVRACVEVDIDGEPK